MKQPPSPNPLLITITRAEGPIRLELRPACSGKIQSSTTPFSHYNFTCPSSYTLVSSNPAPSTACVHTRTLVPVLPPGPGLHPPPRRALCRTACLSLQAAAVLLVSDEHNDANVLLVSFELEQVLSEIPPGHHAPKVSTLPSRRHVLSVVVRACETPTARQAQGMLLLYHDPLSSSRCRCDDPPSAASPPPAAAAAQKQPKTGGVLETCPWPCWRSLARVTYNRISGGREKQSTRSGPVPPLISPWVARKARSSAFVSLSFESIENRTQDGESKRGGMVTRFCPPVCQEGQAFFFFVRTDAKPLLRFCLFCSCRRTYGLIAPLPF